MSVKSCECCLKPETACECLGPRSLACDFCGHDISNDEAFYESKAYRVVDGEPQECSEDSAVISCERCEESRMRVVRRRRAA